MVLFIKWTVDQVRFLVEFVIYEWKVNKGVLSTVKMK